jgi:hypothetical protein
MDPQEPPAAAPDMAGQVKGEWFFLVIELTGISNRWKHLDPPDLVVHQSGTGSQRCTAFLGPPLPALVPSDWLGAD